MILWVGRDLTIPPGLRGFGFQLGFVFAQDPTGGADADEYDPEGDLPDGAVSEGTRQNINIRVSERIDGQFYADPEYFVANAQRIREN